MKLHMKWYHILLIILASFGAGLFAFRFCLAPAYVPDKYSILVDLLIIFLALIGAAGYGIYRMLSAAVREEAKKTAQQEYGIIIVKLQVHVCALWGRTYEALLRVTPPGQQRWLDPFTAYALLYGEKAIEYAESLDEKIPEKEKLCIAANNNCAMALALRGDVGTAKTAEKIVQYLEQKAERYRAEARWRESVVLRETVGFVRWRLPRSQKDMFQAEQTYKELQDNPDIDEEVKKLYEWRWKYQFPQGKL